MHAFALRHYWVLLHLPPLNHYMSDYKAIRGGIRSCNAQVKKKSFRNSSSKFSKFVMITLESIKIHFNEYNPAITDMCFTGCHIENFYLSASLFFLPPRLPLPGNI